MKILITGSNGQLGNEMRLALSGRADTELFLTDIAELDITDEAAIEAYVTAHGITNIVNCAAYTSVDKAEEDEATAKTINVDAVRNLGLAAQRHNIRLLHISTDYVFNGSDSRPYSEAMPADPRTAYGRTKYAGEQALTSVCREAIIIRTAWLYSSFGNNFVKTMLRLSAERPELNVVYDQVGSPTYAADLARAIVKILFENRWQPGVYHFTDAGVCSWYDFTQAIVRLAGRQCRVNPILSSEYQYRTPRPAYSVLDTKKIRTTFAVETPYWLDSLERCIEILNKQ